MRRLFRFWSDLSVSSKLYSVFGVMAVLIACELFTLQFAMRTLSGARALVGGESLWSKAQKDAVFSLLRFGATKDEMEWEAYKGHLKIPDGDHMARLELQKLDLDTKKVTQGFIDGRLHPDDIPAVIDLLRRFHRVEYLARAIEVWTLADGLLDKLKAQAIIYHDAVLSDNKNLSRKALSEIKAINAQLTVLEEEFSYVLGVGSRWIEKIVLTLLTVAVLMVETVGVTLTFVTSRSISKSLKNLNEVSKKIGDGQFNQKADVHSKDELGTLAESINTMGGMLSKTYGELEARVKERTEQLGKLALENEGLYQEAKKALQVRDEFLSIASHELKTPITSLKLQLQALKRNVKPDGAAISLQKISQALHVSEQQVNRLTTLIEDLLDVSRIEAGKLVYVFEKENLCQITKDVLERYDEAIKSTNGSYELQCDGDVYIKADRYRLEQVLINLISNAMKYGEGRAIKVKVSKQQKIGLLSVEDKGIGIEEKDRDRIFNRFERAATLNNSVGLGLGLYISKVITEAHQGHISVKSKMGEGTLFIVEIPLVS